jgi:hypothetical protein
MPHFPNSSDSSNGAAIGEIGAIPYVVSLLSSLSYRHTDIVDVDVNVAVVV